MIQNSQTPLLETPPETPLYVSDNGKKQRQGVAWVLGSFVFCPCHLPFTLGLLAAIFSGTALGAVVTHYSIIAGIIITLVWASGTWYGFRKLRASQKTAACAIPKR
jgi:hypothetical protein